MTLITADFVLTCNEDFEIIEEGAVVFDATILEVGKSAELKAKHPNVTVIETPKNSVILPGLINSHVHLEFSANQSMLRYGDFIPWLRSVIKHREELSALATTELITCKLQEMLKRGTTTLGAISSFGADLEACAATPQRVVYFNEVLGSVPSAVDAMYGDFRGRLEASKAFTCKRFIPAVSVHSPYSTHPILAKKALQIAREEQCVVSTHFMESAAERAWIDEGKGDFETFFSAFNPHAKPMCSSVEFLELFSQNPTLFTHAVQATQNELEIIAEQKATLTHCPVSNRLLGVGKLDLEAVQHQNINLTLGTDGLSSNISLSLWDEMRSALMMHAECELSSLAKMLLQSVTCNAAKALQLPCGVLEKERYADLIVATLPQACEKEDVALQLILHTHQTHLTFIDGEQPC
ncbi:aminofutalosine deaminase family hydrolase [Sulfurospirillum halorespirans]|uniref:Deaminase family protein n=1 Tax=Sulfurospirillum halorespirans DSM 13726 TaxID=1193502 RepID=A0A1D7TGN8_9BACT|nr:metal-dependent hydrolase [Sulfurospirillum halorespirans]AOO64171.1 deaminase family protein [Sulfurospirillum halorespirans DSM 13726]